ncbi:MAG: hypothetical protein K8I30_03805, partial [Anaerolineae bacterium]|nr:hypothetical protein [Anaerolineae bacterium]
NSFSDVFVYDRQTSQISQVSAGGNRASLHPALSADSRFTAFISFADNLVPGDGDALADLFVYDGQAGTMARIVIASAQASSDRVPVYPAISDDGRYLAFESEADGLVAGDNNGLTDIFVYDTQSGVTALASAAPNNGAANGASTHPRLSADGRRLVFQSEASNLVAGDNNGLTDIFVRDLPTGDTKRLTLDPNCAEANGASYAPDLSADGRYAAFTSEATNLIPGDSTLCQGERCADVFVAALDFAPVVEDLPLVAPVRNFFAGAVRLTWRGVSWATHYHIQVSKDRLFPDPLDVDVTVNAATLALDVTTLDPETYYWHVQAQKIDDSWSGWSAVETFTVSP